MVYLEKLNETYIVVHSEDDVARTLWERFSFFSDNYYFHPKFKEGIWDGKIRIFNMGQRTIYIGLLKQVVTQLEDMGEEYIIDPQLAESMVNTEEFVQESMGQLKSLKYYSKGQELTVRDDQWSAIERSIRLKRSLNQCPTSFGKSLCIFAQVMHNIFNERRTLLIATQKSLVDQLAEDFRDYATDAEGNCYFSPSKYIHTIYSGQVHSTSKPVVITTWQSLMRHDEDWLNQFDSIICDEAHGCKATQLRGILERASQVKYRTGWSGTFKGVKSFKMVLEGLVGPIKSIIDTKTLMDRGIVAQLKIHACYLQYSKEIRELISESDFREEEKFFETNKSKMKFTVGLVSGFTNSSLILVGHIAHAKKLFDKLCKVNPKRNLYIIHGQTIFMRCGDGSTKTFKSVEDVKPIIESDDDGIIVASFSYFSTGISIKNIHNIVFGSSTKSYTRVLQSIGRGLRVSATKKKIDLFDLVDEATTTGKKGAQHPNYAMKHFGERFQIYSAEKFIVQFHKFDMSQI